MLSRITFYRTNSQVGWLPPGPNSNIGRTRQKTQKSAIERVDDDVYTNFCVVNKFNLHVHVYNYTSFSYPLIRALHVNYILHMIRT